MTDEQWKEQTDMVSERLRVALSLAKEDRVEVAPHDYGAEFYVRMISVKPARGMRMVFDRRRVDLAADPVAEAYRYVEMFTREWGRAFNPKDRVADRNLATFVRANAADSDELELADQLEAPRHYSFNCAGGVRAFPRKELK